MFGDDCSGKFFERFFIRNISDETFVGKDIDNIRFSSVFSELFRNVFSYSLSSACYHGDFIAEHKSLLIDFA